MFSFALRNLFRHRVRSTVALSAIAFATIALILSGGFIEWVFWAMREAATDAGNGHVQVVRPGYFENGVSDPLAYLLPSGSTTEAAIAANPHVKALAPRLDFTGLVSFGETSLAFAGVGVAPDREAIVSHNLTFMDGENLKPGDDDGIIVGMGLAHQLGVTVGDRVVLLVSIKGGRMTAAEGQVRGIFATKVKAVDDISLRVPLAVAQRLLRVTGAHTWVVLLDDADRLDPIVADFRSRFDAQRFAFVRWLDVADFYNKTVALLGRQMDVVRALVSTIIVLGISNMLVMNVLERTGEIGTLLALGARRRKILSLFVIEGLLLGLLGGLLGLVLASGLAWLISTIGIPMPPPPGRTVGYSGEILLTAPLCLTSFAIAMITTIVASVYPAFKASRLVIVDALRKNR